MRAADFAELQAFMAIAQERSFRRAAGRLNLTPSTAATRSGRWRHGWACN